MADVEGVKIGTASTLPDTLVLKTDDGVNLLPDQVVNVDRIYTDYGDWPPSGVEVIDSQVMLSRPDSYAEEDSVIYWSGSYRDITELYDSKYKHYIASQHERQPRYRTVVTATVDSPLATSAKMRGFQRDFDIDHAIGAQLDAVGLWLGLSRAVKAPITGVFFTWNDAEAPADTGWDYGAWKGRFGESDGVQTIPDDVYRRLLKAKAVANRWRGTVEGLQDIWSAFEGSSIVISDNQNMTMDVEIVGRLSGLEKQMLKQGYISIKPMGVAISSYRFTES